MWLPITGRSKSNAYPLTQILITDKGGAQEVPQQLRETIGMTRKHLGDSDYLLFGHDSLREFIQKHFGREVVAAYDDLRPFSYKADLGRYCAVYVRGGWYVDIGLRVQSGFNPPENVDAVLFRDLQQNSLTSWSCCSGLFFAKPNQKFLQTAVEMILNNVKNRYYGITPLCPTGPTLLGHALAVNGANKSYLFGDVVRLTPAYSNQNNAVVLPSGQILAFLKAAEGGDLTRLGVRGGNNYNRFWHKKNVYR